MALRAPVLVPPLREDLITQEKPAESPENCVVFLNNSNYVLDFSVDLESNAKEEALIQVVRNICPEWSQADQNEFEIEPVSGGITNLLYRVTAPGRGGTGVLVRLYGKNTEILIDRERDCAVFADLARGGFAPALRGRFRGGRVEENLRGARPLAPPEMARRGGGGGGGEGPDFVALIARELARMHRLDVPAARAAAAAPAAAPAAPAAEALEGGGAAAPLLFATLEEWRRGAEAIAFPGQPAKAAALAALDVRGAQGPKLAWLRRRIEGEGGEGGGGEGGLAALYLRTVVFSHQDLLSGNILYNDSWDHVRIIDYEYGGYNYRGFDIANHFCEYAGFDFDIKNHFPNKEQQLYFLEKYVSHATPELHAKLTSEGRLGILLEELYQELKYFVLASHLWWGYWAIMQAKHSPIDFDYMGYARLRFEGFDYHTCLFFPEDAATKDNTPLHMKGDDDIIAIEQEEVVVGSHLPVPPKDNCQPEEGDLMVTAATLILPPQVLQKAAAVPVPAVLGDDSVAKTHGGEGSCSSS